MYAVIRERKLCNQRSHYTKNNGGFMTNTYLGSFTAIIWRQYKRKHICTMLQLITALIILTHYTRHHCLISDKKGKFECTSFLLIS